MYGTIDTAPDQGRAGGSGVAKASVSVPLPPITNQRVHNGRSPTPTLLPLNEGCLGGKFLLVPGIAGFGPSSSAREKIELARGGV
jgi:hypothetical protein